MTSCFGGCAHSYSCIASSNISRTQICCVFDRLAYTGDIDHDDGWDEYSPQLYEVHILV